MNKYMIKSIGWMLSLTLLSSCANFDDINTNPNASTKVTADMLATGLLIGMTKQNFEYTSFTDHNSLSKHVITAELIRNELYNKIARGSFGSYSSLISAAKMVENAGGETKSAYEALASFIKAYKLFYLSLDFGDIPYSEALQGETTGLVTPKYDSQKEVMRQVLAELDKAESLFSTAKNFAGDPILNGNVKNWVKVTNAFKLKVLINLCYHDADPDLKVKAQFEEILTKRSIMQSNADNFQLVYSNKGGQIYPFNSLYARSHGYCMLTSNLVDSLKALNDNRLFYFAEPTAARIEEGRTAGEFEAYVSIDPTLPFDKIKKAYNDKLHCNFNKRYTDVDNQAGEPVMRIGYAEQCFNIAEGIVRGWAKGDAKAYYEEGIRAAMLFVKDHTPSIYVSGRPAITEEYIQNYLKGEKVAFAATPTIRLNQLFQQKYFIYFLQNPYDGYYENRRCGYPVLPIDPKTNMNQVPDQLPKRWMYPQTEYDVNAVNVKAAIERQYGGRDENNDLMWILKTN